MKELIDHDYVNPGVASQTMAIAEYTRKKVSQALNGASLSKLSGLSDYEAFLIKQSRDISVSLASFDRSNDDQKRSERTYRKYLLPGVLQLVSDDFKVDTKAIDEPENFSELATLVLPERSISVVRILTSVETPVDVNNVNSLKLLAYGDFPAVVRYQLLVQDSLPNPAAIV